MESLHGLNSMRESAPLAEILPEPYLDTVTRQSVAIVELGVNEAQGTRDGHAQAVLDVFLENAGTNVGGRMFGLNFDDPAGDGAGVLPFAPVISTMSQLDQYVDAVSCNVLNAVSNKIVRLLREHPGIQVLNLSLGKTRAEIYQDVAFLLSASPKLQREFRKRLKLTGLLFEAAATPKVLVEYVNTRMDIKRRLHAQALQRYQIVTQNAAQAGLVIVVAADNDHQLAQFYGVAGSDFNFLAQCHHVISVAAVDRAGRIWEGSSRGNAYFRPTLSAMGVEVETSVGCWTGTSFATPSVSTTVAKMLAENPDLGFHEIQTILEETAFRIPGKRIAVGAGWLHPKTAIAEAGRRAKKRPKRAKSA